MFIKSSVFLYEELIKQDWVDEGWEGGGGCN